MPEKNTQRGANTVARQPARFKLIDTVRKEEISLDGLQPTQGLTSIDVSPLRPTFQMNAFDPAYKSTSMGLSSKTFIDGEQGILTHGGYRIEDLTDNSNFMEVTYLLREGELPTATQLADFKQDIGENANVPPEVRDYIKSSNPKAKPMATLAAAVSTLAANTNDENPHHIIGQMSTIVANLIRRQQGKEAFLPSNPDLDFAENFLRMAFADDNGHYDANPAIVEAMDKLLILHADHEQNASTTNVRNTRSAGSTMAECIAAGVNTLSGPLHGGANQAVLEQLEMLATADTFLPLETRIERIIARAKDKDDDFRLMGFGHRVYKNRDPRAMVLKKFVDSVLAELDVDDPRLETARRVEKAAAKDEYFTSRGLYPNVDFYSGIIMSALELEPRQFTMIFAAGRVAGWEAQAEELNRDKMAIARPRQTYVGPTERPYIAIEQRGEHNGGPALEEPKELNQS